MIHPTAVIEEGAHLGAEVQVGPFAYIESGATLGARCRVGPHAVVYRWATLGADCRVHAGAVLGDEPQDTSFEAVDSFVRIGDRCVLREGVTVHRGTKADTTTTIGDDCFLMAFSHVGHNAVLGRSVILANGALVAGYGEVGDGVFMAGGTGLHQFTRIGRLAMVGGNSGISSDLPPFCTSVPCALNRVLGLNTVGLRRAGFTVQERKEVKDAFAEVYRSGNSLSHAVARIRERHPKGPAAEFADFIASSKRGICGVGH